MDQVDGTITARGHIDRLGADLLRGTVESLKRRGHQTITLQVHPFASTDGEAQMLLASLADELGSHGAVLPVH